MLADLGFQFSRFLISFLVFSCSGGTETELAYLGRPINVIRCSGRADGISHSCQRRERQHGQPDREHHALARWRRCGERMEVMWGPCGRGHRLRSGNSAGSGCSESSVPRSRGTWPPFRPLSLWRWTARLRRSHLFPVIDQQHGKGYDPAKALTCSTVRYGPAPTAQAVPHR